MHTNLPSQESPRKRRRSYLAAAVGLIVASGGLFLPYSGQRAVACEDHDHATSQPAAPPDTAEGWLDLIETRTAELKTLQANVRYDRIQVLTGDEQRRFGTLVYRAGPPAAFAIRFNRMIADRVPHKLDKSYIFDGRGLVERDALNKKFLKTQVVAPDADPEKANPLALGDGPFALPLGGKKKDILNRFNVELIAPSEDDPTTAETVHLRLTAKPDRDIEYDRIDLWYHRKLLVPIRAATKEAGSDDTHIFHLLSEPRLNQELAVDAISTKAPPKGAGWYVEITPWDPKKH